METDRAGADGGRSGEEEEEEEASTSAEAMSPKKEPVEQAEQAEQSSRKIFRLSYVNSYGSSDTCPEMQDNGSPLRLHSKSRRQGCHSPP